VKLEKAQEKENADTTEIEKEIELSRMDAYNKQWISEMPGNLSQTLQVASMYFIALLLTLSVWVLLKIYIIQLCLYNKYL